MNNEEFRTLVTLATRVICRDLKLTPPEICFTERDFNRGLPSTLSNLYVDNAGYMLSSPARMFVRRDNCLVHTIEAVAHELVHFKYPELKHGKKFNDTVATILHARVPRLKRARARKRREVNK